MIFRDSVVSIKSRRTALYTAAGQTDALPFAALMRGHYCWIGIITPISALSELSRSHYCCSRLGRFDPYFTRF